MATRTRSQPPAPTGVKAFARKVLPPVILAAAIVTFVTAFLISNTGDGDSVIVTQNRAIERLIPAPDSEVLRQTKVGIDLIGGFDAELVINGIPIPLDQININRDSENPDETASNPNPGDTVVTTALSTFEFQPLEGRAIEELKADQNCAVATFWPLSDPTNIDSVEWCFTVA